MVAFVNGKFINVSAHTSYLILLKNYPHKKSTTAKSLSDRRAGRFILESATRCWAGRPLYSESEITVNAVPEKLLKNFARGHSDWPRNSQTGGAL
jgi:hypothetical protein